MSENFEQRVNGLQSPSFVADKNANKIACKKKRPSRVNYGAGVFEGVDESERTLEQDSNLVFGNDGGTQSEPSLLGSVAQGEIGDCTDQETPMMNIGSPCTTSAVTQLQTYPNLKEQSCLLGDGTAVTSMQDENILASVPYSPNANVREFDKHTFHTPFEIKVAIEDASDPTHMEVETTVLRRPQSFDESLEPMLDMSEDILTVSFPSFPSVFCDEMHMRTNSFVSCTAENPQSTSVLETSQVAQTSSDVFSGLTRPPHEMPDICKGTSSIFTEEMDCVDLPPPIVGSKSEMEKAWLNDKRNCVSEHAHCLVPDQNSEQHMECDAHNAQVLSPEARQRAPLSLERESKIRVSDSAQSSTPNVQTTPIIQNYEDTFSFGMPNGVGRCTTSTPILQSKNATFFVSELEDLSETIKPASIEFGYGNENLDSKTKKRFLTAASKTRKPDVINFPKPNFNNIKPRVMTRNAMLSKESHAEKNSPRSPQSGSAASSPLTSPRMALLSTRLGKRAAVEQDLKLETVMVRLHQQAPNKHSFASHTANVAACSKHLLSKAPRTGSAFKQSRGDVDRGSSTNSAVSSASPVACIQSFKMPENKTERPKVPPKPNHLTTKQKVPGLNECNLPPRLTNQDLVKPLARNDRSEVAPKVPVSMKVTSTTGKNVQKENASNLRSTTAFKATTIKQKAQSSETGKHDSISKNISTTGILSPRQNNQPVSNGLDSSTPKEKPAVKALAAIAAKTQILRAFPKSRLPCKESTIQRTASLSSVDSSQSRHSANSVRSTGTNNLKNGKAPAAACRSKSVSTPPAAKALVSRIKVQPLRIIQTGLRGKSSALCEGAPRSAGLRKTDGKINSHIGITGPNAARYASVEKSKPKASPKTPYTPTQISEEKKSIEFAQCRSKCEKQSGIIVQLKQLVASGNQRFEALTVVIQQLLKEREEILKQRRAFSQELISLRGDLVTSSSTCERLEKEKNELQAVYEGILEKLKDQHQLELEELEEKLKEFYTDQCEKLKNAFFEEAEKYKLELQGKVDELNATHEQFRLEIEKRHVDTVKQIEVKHENTLSELKATQEHERTVLEDSLTEKQDVLQKSVDELKTENESLREKLKTEEEQRKLAKEKTRKNSQIMYLEQELESLKAVMEIKNEKLHQQDKKLMQVEKLVDNNATLFEKLKKSQQENEDLKARMDKHMALSRQLSTEQAVLQESLEKESKVNKRLSMENEELLWKLHNGDLCSPKKLSPTSPIPFQSSRSTGSFSSPTVSPR